MSSKRRFKFAGPEVAEALLVRSDLVEVEVVDPAVDQLLGLRHDRIDVGPQGTELATIAGVTIDVA